MFVTHTKSSKNRKQLRINLCNWSSKSIISISNFWDSGFYVGVKSIQSFSSTNSQNWRWLRKYDRIELTANLKWGIVWWIVLSPCIMIQSIFLHWRLVFWTVFSASLKIFSCVVVPYEKTLHTRELISTQITSNKSNPWASMTTICWLSMVKENCLKIESKNLLPYYHSLVTVFVENLMVLNKLAYFQYISSDAAIIQSLIVISNGSLVNDPCGNKHELMLLVHHSFS